MTTTSPPIRRLLRVAVLAPLVALSACASPQRFGGPAPGGFGGGQASQALPPAPPISSAPVLSEPLPPPGGYPVASAPPASGPLPPPGDPFFEPTPAPVAPAPPPQQPRTLGGGGEVATLGGAPRATPSRDGVIGAWTAREATGGSCRVQLSSTPSLDVYRASASGCANRDLQSVNAWDYRGGEVYLYQQGGSVVARLRAESGSAMAGAVTKSGAALSLSR